MSILDRWRRPSTEARDAALSLSDYISALEGSFQFSGITYTLPSATQESIGSDYQSLVRGAYKSSPIVFACMERRAQVFSQARFQFRRVVNGRPGELWGNPNLSILEKPWPGGTTSDLLKRMIQYADLGGNAYVARVPGKRLMCLRPDWVTIAIGSFDDPDVAAWDVNAELLGYLYQPGGPQGGRDIVVFGAHEVAHFAPIPDPEARFRGMSWLSPVVREIQADKAATDHKQRFFENGATPNMIVKFDIDDLEKFKVFTEKFREDHEGRRNAFRTLFLARGMDATVVGANLEQIEFKATQGAGETRIASAAGVPPIIAGFSEGLEAATYSNYGQARRAFGDITIRPLWGDVAGSLQQIVDTPNGSELWYDPRLVAFLQEDMKDAAEVMQLNATASKTLVDAGYTPDSVVTAVAADDLSLLVHSGLVSVQLQPPGTNQQDAPESDPNPGEDEQ